MPNILRLNKISPLAEKIFPASYKLVDECAAPDAIVLRSFNMHEYALPESLLAVARAGAGVNNIPLDKCAEKGIVVFNTPGANANAVKELVISAMLLSGRKISSGIDWANSLKGQDEVAKKIEDGKKAFIGGEIMGKTLGVIGLGAIGLLVANAAVALGMNVIGRDPFLTPEKAKMLDSKVKTVDTYEEIYSECDFITLHVPLADSTRNMINADTLALCRNGVNIINCARGELVNNNDIKAALVNKKVNRYVTDFPTGDLLCVDGIIPIPHLGASTPEAEDNCAFMAAEELLDFIENGNIINSVNYPAVKLDRKCCKKPRITVAFKGDLDINAIAAEKGIKVCCINSAKRGNYGYAIIDLNEDADISHLNNVNGILKVRKI